MYIVYGCCLLPLLATFVQSLCACVQLHLLYSCMFPLTGSASAVCAGYYTALKSLLESHVPEPDDPTLSPPTPLADSLLKLITLPLLVSPPERR